MHRLHTMRVSLLALALCVGVTVPPASAQCSYLSCSACTNTGSSTCGWCTVGTSTDGSCHVGRPAPTDGSTCMNPNSYVLNSGSCPSTGGGGSSDDSGGGGLSSSAIYSIITFGIFGLLCVFVYGSRWWRAHREKQEKAEREAAAVPVFVPDATPGSSPLGQGNGGSEMTSPSNAKAHDGVYNPAGVGGTAQVQQANNAAYVAEQSNPYAVRPNANANVNANANAHNAQISDEQYQRALGLSAGQPHMASPQQQPPQSNSQYSPQQQQVPQYNPQQYQQSPPYGQPAQSPYGQPQQPYYGQPPQQPMAGGAHMYAQPSPFGNAQPSQPGGYGMYQPASAPQQQPAANNPYAAAQAMLAGQAAAPAPQADAPPPFAHQSSSVPVPPYAPSG